ncbi:DUF4214 domain-containing protein [Massilia sp. YIM B02443]|uniref:DUF4214 domain-containing protein n=1 Tax=Massilia sp. YIM B02443 TaxID=3050127 RepID=UPI0025B6CF11|nr:DUF4214 domain-containing protein [Massilia sp. YIM B02443]MDN4036803.1 DUF4214 domain-containing protein [Massilia sp. YIM B02443]
MASPRALIEMVVDGAAESRRRIETVGDALRRMNNESLQRISGQMSDLTDRYSNLQSTIGNVAGFAVAGVSLATLGSKIGDVLGSMGELDDLSQKTGTSVESLSKIQKVAKAFGVDFAGSVDPALVKFARGLTTVDDKSSKTAKALAAIGVSAKDSAGNLRDPGKVMVEVAKSLQKYQDGAGKAAVVTDLFGKSGADLLPFFNDLADTVDDFSETSGDAVAAASALQDKFGKLGVQTEEVFTAIVSAALPACTSLVDGFSDVIKEQDKLVDSKKVGGWADSLAVGFARVADVAALVPRAFSAIGGSFEAVGADVSVMQKMLEVANPINAARMLSQGRSPTKELQQAIAERNRILDAANQKYDDLWNKPANQFEQAVLKRISNRIADVAPQEAASDSKGTLRYPSGGEANDTKKAADAYANLTAAIQAKITASKLELSSGVALEPSQQEQLRLTEQLAGLKDKLTPIQRANVENMIQESVTLLEVIESQKRAAEGLESYNKLREQYDTNAAKVIQDATNEAIQNEQLALTYGKTKGAVEAFELARLEEQLAQRSSKGLTLDEITNLEKLIAVKKRSATALATVDKFDAGKKAAESLTEFLDPAKAQSFGEALRESLGGAGTALSALTATLDGFGKRQAEIDKQRANAALAYSTGQRTEMQNMQDLARLSEMETKSRLSGYGDMAGAAAGFFGEQSRGYQTLMTVSKVFHAAELAMTMAELVPKGIAAVLNQGNGDPYTAFGRMAAMGALVAGLGVAIGGTSGSGPSLSESRQKQQGTGTVLGSDAKSGSIARALEQIEQSTLDNLGVSNDMLISLRNIESEIGQFASLLVRTTGVTGDFGKDMEKSVFDSKAIGIGGAAAGGIAGAAAGAYVGMGTSYIGAMLGGPVGMALGAALGAIIGKTFVGKALGSIFGGKQTVEDTGFSVDKTDFRSIFAGGLNAMQYADIKKDGGWFSSDKKSTATQGLGEEGNRQISSVLTSLYDTVYEAGQMLGFGADTFNAQLSSFVVDIGKVSLKGLSDDEIQEELEGVFSKVGDDLAKFGVAGLDQFQKVGEGYLETLARVATNYTTLDAIMASIGTTFGATGMESLAARERLIGMAGGISELAQQTSAFSKDFLTEAQRLAPVQQYVTSQLAAMGLASVDTRDEFRDVVLGMDRTTEAGAKQFTVLMSLAEAFAQVYPAAEETSKSMQEVADEQRSLQDQIDQLTMTRAQLLEKERNAVAEANRPMWDRLQALMAETAAVQAAKDAAEGLLSGVDATFGTLQRVVDRERAVLQSQVQSHTEAANKLRAVSSSLRSTIDGMRGPGNEAADRARAQSDLSTFVAIARAGGVFPDSEKLQATLSILSQDASEQFETFADYQRDLYRTRNSMADLADLSDAALSTEERALKTLEEQLDVYDQMLKRHQEQVELLKGQSVTGLSILDAIRALQGSILAAQNNPMVAATSAINNAYQTHLGRAPDAAGFEWWKNAAAGGAPVSQIVDGIANSAEADLRKLYQSALGRAPDAEGLAYWMNAFGPTMDAAERAEFLKGATPELAAIGSGSQEDFLKQKGVTTGSSLALRGIPGFATGGDHSGGWRIVGENGPELEATGPSRIFNATQTNELMGRLMQPTSGSDALVAEVRALRAEVAALREANSAENRAIAGGAQAAAEHLDAAINGDKPLAMKVIPA